MTTLAPSRELVHDEPHPSGDDRYAIYSVANLGSGAPAKASDRRVRIAETSEEGLGITLRTLYDEGQITNETRVGILDRLERRWIVNPWAAGTRLP